VLVLVTQPAPATALRDNALVLKDIIILLLTGIVYPVIEDKVSAVVAALAVSEVVFAMLAGVANLARLVAKHQQGTSTFAEEEAMQLTLTN
jgi:hypothetical protein